MGEGVIKKMKPLGSTQRGWDPECKWEIKQGLNNFVKGRKAEQICADRETGQGWMKVFSCVNFLDVARLLTWDGRGGDCQKLEEGEKGIQ